MQPIETLRTSESSPDPSRSPCRTLLADPYRKDDAFDEALDVAIVADVVEAFDVLDDVGVIAGSIVRSFLIDNRYL